MCTNVFVLMHIARFYAQVEHGDTDSSLSVSLCLSHTQKEAKQKQPQQNVTKIKHTAQLLL